MRIRLAPLFIASALVTSAAAHAQSGSMQPAPSPSPRAPKPPRKPSQIMQRDLLQVMEDEQDNRYRRKVACDARLKKGRAERKTCRRVR